MKKLSDQDLQDLLDSDNFNTDAIPENSEDAKLYQSVYSALQEEESDSLPLSFAPNVARAVFLANERKRNGMYQIVMGGTVALVFVIIAVAFPFLGWSFETVFGDYASPLTAGVGGFALLLFILIQVLDQKLISKS